MKVTLSDYLRSNRKSKSINLFIFTGILLFLFVALPIYTGGNQARPAPIPQEQEALAHQITEPLQDLRVGVFRGPTAVGLSRSISQGVTLPNGGVVDFELVGAPDVMVARIVNREVDLAVLPINLAARLHTAGQPLSLVAVTGMGMLSVVSADPAIVDLASLQGTIIHSAGQGATPDYVFRSILLHHQMQNGRDLEIDFSLAYPEITASLIAGRITTALLPEPFATMATTQNPRVRRVINIQELWAQIPGNPTDFPMTALVARTDILDRLPYSTQIFLDSYRESLEWIQANPQEAGVLTAQLDLGIPGPVATSSIPRSAFGFWPASEPATKRMVESLLERFVQIDPASIGGRLPGPEFYR
jgi:NitT/TauT family transport system substrate-binding protein